jgi:hypothetical protein
MARRKPARRARAPKSKHRKALARSASRPPHEPAPHFVGREGSPVLDKYPTKPMDAAVGEVISARTPAPKPAPTLAAPPVKPRLSSTVSAPTPSGPPRAPEGPPKPLISLEKPFDIDDFSQLLGQTQIQVTVPRDSLAEVLRRACDFMGFGIYVYSIRVRPGPEELLKTFIVELQRVDFSGPQKDWVPFQDRGRSDSPFGPTGTR